MFTVLYRVPNSEKKRKKNLFQEKGQFCHKCSILCPLKRNENSILLPADGVLTVGMPGLQRAAATDDVDDDDDDAFSHQNPL